MTLPVVDLAPWRESAARTVPPAVDEALRTSGSFQLVGHALPQAALDAVKEQAGAFFTLPDEAKLPYAASRAGRGWLAPQASSPVPVDAPSVTRDCTESFVLGALPPMRGRSGAESHWFPENVWPHAEVPALRPAAADCAMRLRLLSDELLRVCAEALGLAQAHFIVHTPATRPSPCSCTGSPVRRSPRSMPRTGSPARSPSSTRSRHRCGCTCWTPTPAGRRCPPWRAPCSCWPARCCSTGPVTGGRPPSTASPRVLGHRAQGRRAQRRQPQRR